MKKLLVAIGLLIGFGVAAQNFDSQNMINARSIYISNAVTFVTNLNSSVATGSSNVTGVVFTNLGGTRVTGSGARYVNLLKNANLWTDSNGSWQTSAPTNACIFVRIVSAGADATNAVSFEFVAVPNGTHEDTKSTAITFSTTAGQAVSGNWRFPLPMSGLAGCRAIMLRKIYTAVAPSSGLGEFNVAEVSLNGFVP